MVTNNHCCALCYTNEYSSAIHEASLNGHIGCLEYLIKIDPKINILEQTPNEKNTALMLASCEGNSECVKYLIDAKSDPSQKNSNGNTALMLASANNHLDCIKYLTQSGSNVNLNMKNKNGSTALIIASYNGNLDCVKYLIDHGSNILEINNDGFTALNSPHINCVEYIKHILEYK